MQPKSAKKTCPPDARKFPLWICAVCLSFLSLFPAGAQTSLRVAKIEIKHVENVSLVSDDLVRGNIRVKVGDPYTREAVDDDVRNLYKTGQFYNIRVTDEITSGGVVLTYILQGNPRLTEIKFEGNVKYTNAKLLKKVTSKVGEPLIESKLFTDSQEIQKLYEKAGRSGTTVTYVPAIDQYAGRGYVTFKIVEAMKIKITDVQFDGARAFTERKLRSVIKTRRHWMWSWITGSGVFKQDQFDDDKEALAEFYRNKGYIDFEIKDIQLLHPTPKTMVVRFVIFEGQQYKVGMVSFQGTTMLPTNVVSHTFTLPPEPKARFGAEREAWEEQRLLSRNFSMKAGDTFTPDGLNKDTDAVRDFYGAKGYIDVTPGSRNLIVNKIPNTESGTMDLEFKVSEGQKSYIEKIEIRGNVKTKDRVIRRELSVSPGDVFDMVRIKTSKDRIEGLNYFAKVDTRPEPTDVPNRKDLIIGVDEKQTGNLTVGAGFSSVDALVGFAEVYQGNFDLFHPPYFTGAGQKFRLKVQLGTERKDAEVEFIEPWFLEKKLNLDIDLYYHELNYLSPNNLYVETQIGERVGVRRALGSDFLIGGLGYTFQDVGISFNKNYAIPPAAPPGFPMPPPPPGAVYVPTNMLAENGYHLISKFDASISWDTRGPGFLPEKGQVTTLTAQIAGPFGGNRDFYKLELKSHWYFRGLFPGHVLEVLGGSGVADGFGGSSVPFFERWYLGGLNSLRGFQFDNVSPREIGSGSDEPIGGDTYWFGSIEYSVPIVEKLRFAVFYDAGNVMSRAYSYHFADLDDNWGFGLRLNLPIGGGSGTPLRLDYGIPIHHDAFNGSSGRFQFSVGFDRPF